MPRSPYQLVKEFREEINAKVEQLINDMTLYGAEHHEEMVALERRIDATDTRVDNHEERITALEKRVPANVGPTT